jgi:6,7-dimethyl-8-ribityllumazine synthase
MKILFAVANFYQEYSREMLVNSLKFLFTALHGTSNYTFDKLNPISKFKIDTDGEVSLDQLTQNIVGFAFKSSIFTFEIDDYELRPERKLFVTIITILGSLEIPQVVSFFLEKNTDTDGVIAQGIIKKGQTQHNEFVAKGCMNGLQTISFKYNIPLTTAIITAENESHIEARIAKKDKKFESGVGQDLGAQSVNTLLDIIEIKNQI